VSMAAGSAERESGTTLRATISPTIPTGTLTRKIERHCDPAMSAEMSRPPSNWPAALAMPAVAP
jgi:hypothetical protein